jgi:hypothetical protein
MASDQKDRAQSAYSYTTTSASSSVVPYGTGNAATATYTGGVTAGGTTVISYSNTQAVGATSIDTCAPQEQGESIYNTGDKSGTSAQDADTKGDVPSEDSKPEEKKPELTLTTVVNALEEEHGLVKVLLDNLTHYCGAVKAKAASEPSLT